jgi:hypothetical protein
LNYNSIIAINKYLKIDTEIILSSNIEKNNELRGQDKVIYINQLLGADIYYNAIGGRELYSKVDFEKNGIELGFLKMGDVSYKQYKNDFVPNLSIIDVLMFNSPSIVREMLEAHTIL